MHRTGRHLSRIQRAAFAHDRGRGGHFSDAVEIRAVRAESDVLARYGTVPVVRAVGGLDDTVETFDAVSGQGNGFKFGPYRADKFLERIYEALFAYEQPETWRKIQQNGMSADNSWENAARKYVELYEWTLRTFNVSTWLRNTVLANAHRRRLRYNSLA